MASIKPYQSKGMTKYRIQVYAGIDPETGKKRYRSRQGITTEREARMIANKLEFEVSRGEDIKKPKMTTFSQVSDAYWESYKLTVRKTTADVVLGLMNNYILPSLGNCRMESLTTGIIQKAINEWSEEIPTAVHRCRNYVQSVCKMALREGIIHKDPSVYVVLPKQQKVKKDDEFLFWNREQVNKFFACLDPDKDLEKVVAFKLLFFGGLRRGELLALTWKDIQLVSKEQTLVNVNKTLVSHGKINPPKTKASYRSVPIMGAELVEMLGKWKQSQAHKLAILGQKVLPDDEQLLFVTRSNKAIPLALADKWLAAVIKKNNLTPVINLHRTRHSFVSNLLLAGVPVPTVMKLAGHSRAETTLAIYSHINQKSKVEAAQTLASYFKQSSKDSGKDKTT
ncbi:tyrosine-type recombinase/integrase [Schleiferilactobacillus perolens]|uniref:tyrosine-type recombinase/integrase n=1 Tax=Schleiferilactobacillus perolens TaxID=100468 RepID=UPI002353FFEB|nr:tyrosine-type recombinase/integrase [Schleiferilactobacillus perolens]MCI2172369.1 site-specific integrase [Schleiferilactobacillus perolens]